MKHRDLEPKMIKQILDLKKNTDLTNIQIADIVGCSRDSVSKYTRLYGDTIGLDLRTIPEKITELWKKGHTINEIAKAIDVCPNTVRNNVVKLGLREKREQYISNPNAFKVEMPPLKPRPTTDIYYPDREYKVKKVVINGKKYVDVSEVYGI